jgi:7-keto-8-aminopelargonate synthetase-like enzyme
MDLFTKLQPFRERLAAFGEGAVPFDTIIEATLSPTEVLINGRPTLMCGSNNYFGLSFHPEVLGGAGRADPGRRRRPARAPRHLRRASPAQPSPIYGKRQGDGIYHRLSAPRHSHPAVRRCRAGVSHASIDGARLSGRAALRVPPQLHSRSARKLSRQPNARQRLVVGRLYSISGGAPLATSEGLQRSRAF